MIAAPWAMVWRLLAVWAGLQLLGAALAMLVRRSDAKRGDGRTAGLKDKFVSFIIITLAVLAMGWLPLKVFGGLLMTWMAFTIMEFDSAVERSRDATGLDAPRLQAWGPVAIAVCFGALYLVKLFDPLGGYWGFLWLVVSTTDAYSQLFGQGWGSHPMAPRLSPAKMWEGFLGGTAVAVAAGLSMRFVFPEQELREVAVLALAVSLAATAGDLLASAAKRYLALKDYSEILGQHGGLLDRFDSLLGAALVFAPVVMALGF